jgi:hypothetical protein
MQRTIRRDEPRPGSPRAARLWSNFRVCNGVLRMGGADVHHGCVDDEATALLLEAVFDIRAVVYEIRDELLGADDGEEEEDACGARRGARTQRRP